MQRPRDSSTAATKEYICLSACFLGFGGFLVGVAIIRSSRFISGNTISRLFLLIIFVNLLLDCL